MSTMRSASSTSQIHDGFATIRSRGSMHRSRSSRNSELLGVEERSSQSQLQQQQHHQLQHQHSLPLAKSSSVTLGEHNNNSDQHDSVALKSAAANGMHHDVVSGPIDYFADPGFRPHAYGPSPFHAPHQQSHSTLMSTTTPAASTSSPTVSTYDVRSKRLSRSSNSFKQSTSVESDSGTEKMRVPSTLLLMPQYQQQQASCSLSESSASPNASTYLYTRPVSPTYCNVRPRSTHHYRSQTAHGALFQPTYYRKEPDAHQYALTKLQTPSPPPAARTPLHLERPRTLHYHPITIITEPTVVAPMAPASAASIPNAVSHRPASSPTAFYSNDTNYYSPAELLGDRARTLHRHKATPTAPVAAPLSIALNRPCDKRYATLSYPKESQRLRQLSRSIAAAEKRRTAAAAAHADDATTMSAADANGSSTASDAEYVDPLDCKIGCQTTLRSKPRIPWYELAIRKPTTAADRRRQSCPPTYEVCDINCRQRPFDVSLCYISLDIWGIWEYRHCARRYVGVCTTLHVGMDAYIFVYALNCSGMGKSTVAFPLCYSRRVRLHSASEIAHP